MLYIKDIGVVRDVFGFKNVEVKLNQDLNINPDANLSLKVKQEEYSLTYESQAFQGKGGFRSKTLPYDTEELERAEVIIK